MRRTQWAVFTSMNPRPSAFRALYDTTPAENAAPISLEGEPVVDRSREESPAPGQARNRYE